MSRKKRPEESERFGQLGDYWLSKKPGSDNWCRTWYDEGTRQTRRVSIGTADPEQAQRALADWYLKSRDLKDEPPTSVTFSDVLERWYNEAGCKLRSADSGRVALLLFKDFHTDSKGEESTIANLKERHAGRGFPEHKNDPDSRAAAHDKARSDGFAKWMLARPTRQGPASLGYVQRIIGIGARSLNWAEEKGMIDRAPFLKNVTVEKANVKRAKRFTLQSLAAFMNACGPRTEHVWRWAVLSIATLGRPEAVLQLTKPQCDFIERTINTNPPGRRQNKKRRPVVPMCGSIEPLLRESRYILVPYSTKRVVRMMKSVRMGFERVRDRAGLGSEYTTYSIRRMMARELKRRGVPPQDIQGMLGHIDPDMEITEGYTGGFDPDFRGPAAQAIDAVFAELAPLLNRPLPTFDAPAAPLQLPTPPVRKVAGGMVGAVGIEPTTACLSSKRSTTELRANVLQLIACGLRASNDHEFPLEQALSSEVHTHVNGVVTPEKSDACD